MPNSEQCPMCKSTDKNMTSEGWTCGNKWHYAPIPPVPEVESGDGLPERVWIASHVAGGKSGTLSRGLRFRSIHDSKQEAEAPFGRHRGVDEIGFSVQEYVKASELRSALYREERLRGLLQMCFNHIGSRAGEGAIEVMREIKAVVTGE